MKLNQNLKDVCLTCFEDFLKEETIASGRSKIYDLLSEAGFINLSKKEVIQYYKQAQRILIYEEMQKPEKERFLLRFYQGEKSLIVIFKAKVLALETYFAKIDAEGKNLKDIINP